MRNPYYLQAFAHYFHNMGMNLTCIKGTLDWPADEKSFKKPLNENWDVLYTRAQTVEEINQLPWTDCSGIGLVLGYNNYRALDFDNLVYPYSCFNEQLSFSEYGEPFCPFFVLKDKILKILKLPLDYKWIVKSGSRKGFHIIFRTESIDDFSSNSWSFSPQYGEDLYLIKNNDFYNVPEGGCERPFCDHYELRWDNHLILPPSMSKDGNYYSFYGDLPTTEPDWVKIDDINNLIDYFSSRIRIGEYKYGNLDSIPYAYYERGRAQLKSFGTSRYKVKDDLHWLEHCNSSRAFNTLAIMYLFGNGVIANIDKSVSYLKKAKDHVAFFNLASLVASGVLRESYSDFEHYLSLCRDPDFEHRLSRGGNPFRDYLEDLNKIAVRSLTEQIDHVDSYYLFFDTETTGLPRDFNAPSNNTSNWPRLVQLSWILTDVKGKIIREENHIVYPDGFTIPRSSSDVNGITMEIAQTNGEKIKDILERFINDLHYCKQLVGHNIDFDKKVVGAEMIRLGDPDVMNNYPSVDTMMESIDFCHIEDLYGRRNKFPKLSELYTILFNETFADAHDALNDVKATMRCFWRLKELGVIVSD